MAALSAHLALPWRGACPIWPACSDRTQRPRDGVQASELAVNPAVRQQTGPGSASLAAAGESRLDVMKQHKETAFECLSDTQRRLLKEFGRRGVRFIVIGGYAIRFYGHLRPAHDLDLVVDCAED